jgi:hypothetical protein
MMRGIKLFTTGRAAAYVARGRFEIYRDPQTGTCYARTDNLTHADYADLYQTGDTLAEIPAGAERWQLDIAPLSDAELIDYVLNCEVATV